MQVARHLPRNPGPAAVLVPSGASPPPHILIRKPADQAAGEAPLDAGNGLSRIMLSVGDAAAVPSRLRAAGFAPTAINRGHIFFVRDPDGYNYEVIERARKP